MKLFESEAKGSGCGGADEPNTFFAAGVEEAGKASQAGRLDPSLHLGGGGAAGGKDDQVLHWGDPSGLDPGEAFLPWVGVDPKMQPAFGQFGPVSLDRCSQPASGGGIVVLGENLPGTGEAGSSRGEVGAEKEEIGVAHSMGDAAKEGEGIKVGKYAEKGEEMGGGRREAEGGKGASEVDFKETPLLGGEAVSGAAGEGKVGVRGKNVSGPG